MIQTCDKQARQGRAPIHCFSDNARNLFEFEFNKCIVLGFASFLIPRNLAKNQNIQQMMITTITRNEDKKEEEEKKQQQKQQKAEETEEEEETSAVTLT
jgi:hypothetical protein